MFDFGGFGEYLSVFIPILATIALLAIGVGVLVNWLF